MFHSINQSMYKDIHEKELGEEPFKLTLDLVKSCIGFPKESDTGRSLLGLVECRYRIALNEGKTEEEAVKVAFDKLAAQMLSMAPKL